VGIGYLRVPAGFKNIRGYFLSGYPTGKWTGSGQIFFLGVGLRVGTIRARLDPLSSLSTTSQYIKVLTLPNLTRKT